MAIEGQRTMSKTQHYRKVTKPLLERKRRARMNHYLDELKDLIVETMESEGEHVTKLEKADILEMTVTFLKTRKHSDSAAAAGGPSPAPVNTEKFRAGYTQAAYEVSRVFASVPGLDVNFGTQLMKHLGYQLKDMKASSEKSFSPPGSPAPSMEDDHPMGEEEEQQGGDVWRPW